jgi:glycosyltransferase involved in cell wall biosynthesis
MATRLRHTAWLCLDDRGAPESRPVPVGVVRVAGPGGVATDLAALVPVLRQAALEQGADVIHAGPVPTAGWAAVRADARPTVVMAWGSDVLGLSGAPQADLRRGREALAATSGFVADASCVVSAAETHGLPATTPRAVFPWGLEDLAFAPRPAHSDLRQRLGWERCHVLVSLRAWHASYRIDVLLDAFARAARVDPWLRLLLLGTGETAPLVRERAAASGGTIVCPGHVTSDATRPYLDAADVYVSTVPSDGSSISLLEAMASGLPAVVVGAAGNLEWIEPGRTGWLIPPGDPLALADAIGSAFSDTSRLRPLGEAARQVVSRRARWHEGVERLFELYEAVA